MFCKYCGNELKEKAKFCPKCGKAVGSDVTETVQAVKEHVNQSIQDAKDTIQHVDVAEQRASLMSARQRLQDIVSHPKDHKIIFAVIAVIIVAIIGLKGFVFTDERYIEKNSDKIMAATINMISGKPMDIEGIPLDGLLGASYQAASEMQKANPGKFASLVPADAMSRANVTYKLIDVQIKKDTAVASYTLTSDFRKQQDSAGIDVVWTDDDKKGWVITDIKMVKDGQSASITGMMR